MSTRAALLNVVTQAAVPVVSLTGNGENYIFDMPNNLPGDAGDFRIRANQNNSGFYLFTQDASSNNHYALVANRDGNVGIGTFLNTAYGLSVMNGNVGIGTWVPGSALQVNNTMTYQKEYNNGNSGTSLTINWNNGNKQKVTMNNNCTFTFTAPTSGVTNLLLKVVEDGTGGWTATWPGAVKWPSASAPTLTATPSQEDVVTCYWDGTDYLCTAALNYTP